MSRFPVLTYKNSLYFLQQFTIDYYFNLFPVRHKILNTRKISVKTIIAIRYMAWLDEDVFQDKENCKDVHCWSNLLEVSADHVHQYVRNHTEKDTV